MLKSSLFGLVITWLRNQDSCWYFDKKKIKKVRSYVVNDSVACTACLVNANVLLFKIFKNKPVNFSKLKTGFIINGSFLKLAKLAVSFSFCIKTFFG